MMACHSVLCFESLSTKPNTDQPAAFLGQSNALLLSEIVKLWWFVCLFLFLKSLSTKFNTDQLAACFQAVQCFSEVEDCQIIVVRDCQLKLKLNKFVKANKPAFCSKIYFLIRSTPSPSPMHEQIERSC